MNKKSDTSSTITNMPKFKTGDQFTADQMNILQQTVHDTAVKNGLAMPPPKKWKTGDALTADDTNMLLDNILKIYEHLKLSAPNWSFGTFKRGGTLEASHMNEIVDSVRGLTFP
ncbi:MAG: hypothetical protein HKM93_08960 [Desulfobacteraceae bacterium]|nr:hypothetical protein [Desulfobacteraceae bacterium]